MEEKDIELAKTIAYCVNMHLYYNEPDFKEICDTHLNNYLCLQKATTDIEEDLKKLNNLIRHKLYQDTLREVLPAIHPCGKSSYLQEAYLSRESEIDILIKKIRKSVSPTHKSFFQKYVKSAQQIKRWYERKLCQKTYNYIDNCYKYYC